MNDLQKRLSAPFFVLLSLPATAMGFALSVQIAALSWILDTQYGLAIDEIGLVWAAGPLAGILGQVAIGIISDNVWFWQGRRRPFILIGGVLAALMLLALPNIGVVSTALGIDGILVVAITIALTLDFAINISFNPTRSIIADVTPEGEKRTKGYTWMQTVSGLFGVLAYGISIWFGNYFLIYFGAVLVLLFSIIPPFFIEEPRELANEPGDDEAAGAGHQASFGEILRTILPLWGFAIYAVYGMTLRVLEVERTSYLVEYILLALTIVLIGVVLFRSEANKPRDEAGLIGFQKVLAAHSFTWVGIQTMFIYLFAYVKDTLPSLNDEGVGAVISMSFLLFNLIAAILPAFVLEPITRRIGRVKTHTACIAIMALGYAGILFFGQTELVIYSFMVILGIGWAATVSLPFAIMSQKVDQAKMGLYMGLFNLSVVLPQLVASLGVGEIVEAAPDKSVMFVICAITLGLSALAWAFVREHQTEEPEVPVIVGSGH